MQVTLTLTLRVTYDAPEHEIQLLEENLEAVAQDAVNNGSLTGWLDAEVESWKAHIQREQK